MSASEQKDKQDANLPDWRDTTVAKVRKIIKDADPEMVEEPKWMGSPAWSHDGIVCVAVTCKDKVKLTFDQGAHLADPDKLFNNGLGKQWRTIDIHQNDKLDEKSLKTLVKAAVEHNQARAKTRIPAKRATVKQKTAK